jgi:two-component system sensor histidine kinase VicK
LVHDLENGENLGIRFMKNVKGRLDILADRNAPETIMKSDTYKNNYINLRNRGATIRFLTEIIKDNIHYCKQLTEIVDEFRHLDGLKGSLCISESEFISTTTWKQRQSRYPIIYSKEKQFIEQQQFIFDTIWKKATSITQRVQEIEKGVTPVFIESSLCTRNSRDKAYGIMSSANNEILQIFSTANAFHRQLDTGGINKLKEMGHNKQGLIIKILTPKDDEIEKIVTKLNDSNFMVKFIEPLSRISIVVVDRKYSIIIETKDDSKQILTDAIGFMTYSNSIPTVLTYAAIFDNFWKQAELYEETSNELYKAKDELEEMKEYLHYALQERSKIENKLKEG